VAGLSSWEEKREYVCVLCGGPIAEGLARLGSVLCHDCRDEEGIDARVYDLRATMTVNSRRLWPRRRGTLALDAGEKPGKFEPPEPPGLERL
jgi:hypothetical protein